jgi:hypothetical protein
MFSKILIAALLLGTAGHSDGAERFAIGCVGTAKFTDTGPTQNSVRDYELPKQTYVVDMQAKRVQRALEPRQEFEDICFRGGYIDEVDFSPGQIAVHSEKAGETCDFKVNRSSGAAEYFSEHDLPTGGYVRIEFKMNCDRTEIPVFDPSRNRF